MPQRNQHIEYVFHHFKLNMNKFSPEARHMSPGETLKLEVTRIIAGRQYQK